MFTELAAFTRTIELMSDAMRRRGGDPTLGRRLAVLFHEAGFDEIETEVVQPGTLHGDAKMIQHLTLINIRTTLLDLGLATSQEIDELIAELADFVNRTDTYVTTARVFQCRGRRPSVQME